jgi:hypothetical protein
LFELRSRLEKFGEPKRLFRKEQGDLGSIGKDPR